MSCQEFWLLMKSVIAIQQDLFQNIYPVFLVVIVTKHIHSGKGLNNIWWCVAISNERSGKLMTQVKTENIDKTDGSTPAGNQIVDLAQDKRTQS